MLKHFIIVIVLREGGDHGIPRDKVSLGHVKEEPMRDREVTTFSIHVKERIPDEQTILARSLGEPSM
jgi:hypothetical protein